MMEPSEQSPSSNAWTGIDSRPLERAVEALVFAADDPIGAARIADIFSEVTGLERPLDAAVEEIVERLNGRFSAENRPVRIERWGGGFRMASTPEVAPFVKAMFRRDQQRRLSRSLLETLAILAYRQPATKPEVEFVRGVESDYAIRRLLELGLVDVKGRSESVGRPLLYGTTPRFLDLFGLSGLADLPNLREIESILDDPSFHRERARLLMKSGGPLPGIGHETGATDESGGADGAMASPPNDPPEPTADRTGE